MHFFCRNSQENTNLTRVIEKLDNETLNKMIQQKEACVKEYQANLSLAHQVDKDCCKLIFINSCFERKCGLNFACSLFLDPILQFPCVEHLRNTVSKCNLDTRYE